MKHFSGKDQLRDVDIEDRIKLRDMQILDEDSSP
jgi:hypothetical protein